MNIIGRDLHARYQVTDDPKRCPYAGRALIEIDREQRA